MRLKYLLHSALIFSAFFGWSLSAFSADDLDDIETDMEAAISESEAAQSEAGDAKQREKEEQQNLKNAKKDASQAMVKAKVKEESAKIEIKKLETQILAAQREKAKHIKLKMAAEKRIVVADEKIQAQRAVLEKVQAERDASKSEKEAQEEILAKKTAEKAELEKSIVADRREAGGLVREIADLKIAQMKAEKNLVQLRLNAQKEAVKKEKLKAERDEKKRQVSSIPKRIVLRAPKFDCDALGSAGDGAAKVGAVKKGTRYELYHVVNKRWVELKLGNKRAFAEKTCF